MIARARTWWAALTTLTVVILEGAGILWRGPWWHRVVLNAVNVTIFVAIARLGDRTAVLAYVAAALLAHYLHLFVALRPEGLSQALRRRFGPDAAFGTFKGALATTLFHFWASIALCMKVTTREEIFALPSALLIGFGTLLGLAGAVARVWAVYLIGVDSYYCRDFFYPASTEEFRRSGPYRYFSNPMYSLGYTAGYGPCVAAGSWEGVAAMAIGQLLVYVFYFVIEKPHLERVYVGVGKREPQAV
jgi:protein-S-isoprenylcysteine O-methyltransferase Ste14